MRQLLTVPTYWPSARASLTNEQAFFGPNHAVPSRQCKGAGACAWMAVRQMLLNCHVSNLLIVIS